MDWDEQVELRNTETSVKWASQLRRNRKQIPDWISTSFRDGQPCEILDDHRGSFNWSLSLRFNDGVEWLVRFAVPGRVIDGDEKIAREVAAISLVKEKTHIPIPAIHAWGLSNDNPLGLGPFIVMDFIHGESLSKLWQQKMDDGWVLRPDISREDLRLVYRQIAGFLLQLSTLRFTCVASPALDKGPLTLKMQEIEAHSGVRVGGCRSKTFHSAMEYFNYVVEQDIQHLREQPNSVDDYQDARAKYEFLHQLKKLIPCFVTAKYDDTEFRLVCDDMRFGNMLVDENLKIIAVLDWEWTYFGPYQMFYSAPRWLLIKNPIQWNREDLQKYGDYLNIFVEELEIEEIKIGLDSTKRLSSLMRHSMTNGQFLFHELIYSCYNGADNLPWKLLMESFKDRLGPMQEAEQHAFATAKLQELETYKKDWSKLKAEKDREEAGENALILKYASHDVNIAKIAEARGLISTVEGKFDTGKCI